MKQIEQRDRDNIIMHLKSKGNSAQDISATMKIPRHVIYAVAARRQDSFGPEWGLRHKKDTQGRVDQIMALKNQGKSAHEISTILKVGGGVVYEAARQAGNPFRYQHQTKRLRDNDERAARITRIMGLKVQGKTSLEIASTLSIPQHIVSRIGREMGDPFKKSDYASPNSDRNQQIMTLKHEGKSAHEIAEQFDLHTVTVQNIAIRAGEPFEYVGHPRRLANRKRDRDIYWARQSGRTYGDIGVEYGIDQARVCRICQREFLLIKQEEQERANRDD